MNKLSLAEAALLYEHPPAVNGKSVIELRALTHGIPPKAARDNLQLFYDEWAQKGVDAWNNLGASKEVFLVGDESQSEREQVFGWWTLPEVIGDRIISRLLHAPKGSCIMLPNATHIVLGILSAPELNVSGKRKVVCSRGDFPSVLHSLQHYNNLFRNYSTQTQNECRFQLDICSDEQSDFSKERIIQRIDSDTAIVFISHVGFVRGERISNQDLSEISRACHKHGALLAVDGYHALGSHPVNVQSIGADLYFGGLLKEGCGSSGCGFLYIKPGVELTPSYSGWFGDAEPFAFNLTPQANSGVRRRFMLGTTAVSSLYHGIEGAKIMLRAGLAEVAEDILSKVEQMNRIFSAAGIKVISPQVRERMSAMIVLEVPEANRFREYIVNEKLVYCDARKNQFIRMAPHIYNSVAEIARAAETIAKAYRDQEYLNYNPALSVGGPVT